MDPSGLPGMFQDLERRAGAAASPAAIAMAHTFERALKRTLTLRTRGAHDFRPRDERGQPPAMRSGALRNSVTSWGGGGDGVAISAVAPRVFYAGIQEWGGSMHARPHSAMHFFSGGEWFLKHVHVGPNPYIRPTVRMCVANGSLSYAAAAAFDGAMWGR